METLTGQGWIAGAAALGLLAAFWPVAQAAKHPETRPLAAWLIFATVFALAAGAVFVAIVAALGALGRPEALSGGWEAVAAILAMLLPPFLAARWAVRLPPRNTRKEATHEDRAPGMGSRDGRGEVSPPRERR